MADVLIIDDDKLICDWIENVVTRLGHHPVSTHHLREGLRKLQSEPFDLVFLDVQMPDGNGLESMPKIKAARSSPEIIVITGLGHPDEAELAIRGGAWDYLEKPASFEAIKLPLLRALEYRAERRPGKLPTVLNKERHSRRFSKDHGLLGTSGPSGE
jgi:two-component system NtrC family response regulator